MIEKEKIIKIVKNVFIILLAIFISYFLANFVTDKYYLYLELEHGSYHSYTINELIFYLNIFRILFFIFAFNFFVFLYYKKTKKILFFTFLFILISLVWIYNTLEKSKEELKKEYKEMEKSWNYNSIDV